MTSSKPWNTPRDPATVLESELGAVNPEFPWAIYLDDILGHSPLLTRYEKEGGSVFSADYAELLHRCLTDGRHQDNLRTGSHLRTLLHRRLSHECVFGLPISGVRKVHPHIAAAELAWMLMGTQDVAWLSRHTSIWDKFAEDGIVPAAYGWRWRKTFGRDQIRDAMDTLANDPSSRQVYISTWDPANDGLDATSTGLPPCPVGFSLQVTGAWLNCSVHLRSSDLAVGLPYDTMTMALLMDAIASELNLGRGLLTMQLDHAHLYEEHVPALEALRPWRRAAPMPFPRWSLSRIEQDPDSYVEAVKRLADGARQPSSARLEAVAGRKP